MKLNWKCQCSNQVPHQVTKVLPLGEFSSSKVMGLRIKALIEHAAEVRYLALRFRISGIRDREYSIQMRNPPLSQIFEEYFPLNGYILNVHGYHQKKSGGRLRNVEIVLVASCEGRRKIELKVLDLGALENRTPEPGLPKSGEELIPILQALGKVGSLRSHKRFAIESVDKGGPSHLENAISRPKKVTWNNYLSERFLKSVSRSERAKMEGLIPVGYVALSVINGDLEPARAKAPLKKMTSAFFRSKMKKIFVKPNSNSMWWYDHAVAERLIHLIYLYVAMEKIGANFRLSRHFVAGEINKLSILLFSESFYCRNQPTRYHNHGLFQDVAILLAAKVKNGASPNSDDWKAKSIRRIQDFIDKGFTKDKEYLVSIENSPGYHLGIQNILDTLAQSGLLEEKTEIAKSLAGMKNFSEVMTLPDGRLAAIGDTHYLEPKKSALGLTPNKTAPTTANLMDAGYYVWDLFGKRHFRLIAVNSLMSTIHKHEDLLSFSLSESGVDWLVDGGYHSHDYSQIPPSYLRSSWAHNTISIDGQHYDLADCDSPESNVTHDESKITFTGSHEAYKKYKCVRKIQFDKTNSELIIDDEVVNLDSESEVNSYSVFHLGPGVTPTLLDDGRVSLTHSGGLRLLLESRETPLVIFGAGESIKWSSLVSGGPNSNLIETYSLLYPLREMRCSVKILGLNGEKIT